jgi:transaldolase
MKIEIYADGSDFNEMISIYKNNKWVSGFTTNPSLMKKANVTNYKEFVKNVTNKIKDLPISFEVFADEIPEMGRQAEILSSYGKNVFVKIPITNTKGEPTKGLIKRLLASNIPVNVTAVFTIDQINSLIPYMVPNMGSNTPSILSIFAGRIADTGVDPKSIVEHALKVMPGNVKILWASCREVYNVYEADQVGCHIVTVTSDLMEKIKLKDKNLTDYSLETVKMFYNDAKSSGYEL